jgi:SWI/SNF-related matrix-associated actin-dependent regulator of chromatin subfamily A3
MPAQKRRAEIIDLTDDNSAYASQPYADASSSQGHGHASSSQGYAQSSQSSPYGRAPKQPRTATSHRSLSGASQHDAVYIDDDEEDVSATQGMSEQEYTWTLYGVMHEKIVGVRYYSGYATIGEMVVVRREPNNAYDSNAIRILNVQGTQIGHLPRGVAAKLAKYLDNRSLLVEAKITGAKGQFECPIELKFYGTNEPVERENLMSQMRADKLPVGHAADRKRKDAAAAKEREKLAKEAAKRAKKNGGAVVGMAGQSYENGMAEFMAGSSQGAFGPGPTLEDIVGGSERYNPRNVEQAVEKYGVKEEDLVSIQFSGLRELSLTPHRQQCPRQSSPVPYSQSYILSSFKACTGCSTRNRLSRRLRAPRTLCSCGSVIHASQMPSPTLRPAFPSRILRSLREVFLQMTWV